MSYVKQVFIMCDYCGEPHGVDNCNNTTAKKQRKSVAGFWVRRGKLDFCSKECCKKYEDRARKLKVKPKKKTWGIGICKFCGSGFSVETYGQLYCDKDCRGRYEDRARGME